MKPAYESYYEFSAHAAEYGLALLSNRMRVTDEDLTRELYRFEVWTSKRAVTYWVIVNREKDTVHVAIQKPE